MITIVDHETMKKISDHHNFPCPKCESFSTWYDDDPPPFVGCDDCGWSSLVSNLELITYMGGL